jgi:hypothetical protein
MGAPQVSGGLIFGRSAFALLSAPGVFSVITRLGR